MILPKSWPDLAKTLASPRQVLPRSVPILRSCQDFSKIWLRSCNDSSCQNRGKIFFGKILPSSCWDLSKIFPWQEILARICFGKNCFAIKSNLVSFVSFYSLDDVTVYKFLARKNFAKKKSWQDLGKILPRFFLGWIFSLLNFRIGLSLLLTFFVHLNAIYNVNIRTSWIIESSYIGPSSWIQEDQTVNFQTIWKSFVYPGIKHMHIHYN